MYIGINKEMKVSKPTHYLLASTFLLQILESIGGLWFVILGNKTTPTQQIITKIVKVLSIIFTLIRVSQQKFLPLLIWLTTVPKFRLGLGRKDADQISLLGHVCRLIVFRRVDLKLPPVNMINAALNGLRFGLWKRHRSEQYLITKNGTGNSGIYVPFNRFDFTKPATLFAMTANPIDVEAILTDKESFPTRGHTGFSLIVGDGLLGMPSGEQHSSHRRLVGQFLSENHLKNFSLVFGEEIEVMLKRWLGGGSNNNNNTMKVNVQYDLSMLTLDCIMRTGFGVERGNKQFLSQGIPEEENELAHGLDEVLKYIIADTGVIGFSLLPAPHINNLIQIFRRMQANLLEYAMDRAKANPDGKTMLSEMLRLRTSGDEDAKTLTDDEIGDELQTIRGAGHETTSNTLTWTLLLLAQNPHELEILRREADEIVQGNVCTYEEAKKCHKHFCAVLETLRLYPTVPSFPREAHRDVVLPSGYDVPKGSLIFVSQRAMNRDPNTWSKPNDFIPARFDEVKDVKMGIPVGNPEAGHKYGFAPFGAANRSCIGQRLAILEAVQILASITRNVEFKLLTKKVVEIADVTLGPKVEGLWFEMKKRE
jgi:cytochrome P450